MGHILRDWFLPEDGIRREVISADIQSFLGNDATVRPGVDESTGRKVKGYWIRAYRNLTSNMISDLKHKSAKWDQESKKSGKRVNYEDSRTYREQGSGRNDTGKSSPRVEVPYSQTPSSRHGHSDAMDYEPSRPVAARPDPHSRQDPHSRSDPHSRTHLANTGAIVGSYVEPIAYPPSRSAPPGYVVQGNEYAPEPGYHSSRLVAPDRGSPQHIPGYGGHPTPHPRDVDMVDTRYPPARDPREEIRYATREDPRYSHSREDVRYAPREEPRYAEDPRHRSTRDDSRYAPAQPQYVREDPRYAPARDHHRDDLRYQSSVSRDDPRLAPAAYKEAPHPASYAQPPAGYDPYGRPYAPPMPQVEQPIYQAQPPPSRMETTRMETQYSNSSRKRGAPPDEPPRHSHHSHGRMR
ncbi:hypothetical protein BDZ85DRAFT_135537 [Elsinoe ampelina]|uniref:Uncharacterized protein n=1 Tax=Elsinoe ampelina TaxID=302913 RepID=A0A6A6G875_9PEZI|nr:hypothetical protein BDZ85DRAFT_135537 [Elsinoe ampelina]